MNRGGARAGGGPPGAYDANSRFRSPSMPAFRSLFVAGSLLAASTAAFAGSPINTTLFGKLAVDGYDVVAYQTDHKAVKGKAEFRYSWQDANWQSPAPIIWLPSRPIRSATRRSTAATAPMRSPPRTTRSTSIQRRSPCSATSSTSTTRRRFRHSGMPTARTSSSSAIAIGRRCASVEHDFFRGTP